MKNTFITSIHKPFLFFIFLLFVSSVNAQFFPTKTYPQNYFIYPVEARISLSANFGELRSNHYHMGLDCRTDQVINKHVRAAAAGYIARVTVAPFGFGQAIYINHPNGMTTVYGHLHRFFPALEKYVTDQQYKQESWNIDLKFSPDQFPVNQGQFIAYSGNTGGSMGPHCHFEIRDTKTDKVFNPLLFNLPIPDKVPPTIVSLYMYDRTKSTYSQSPVHLPIKKLANEYTTTVSVIPIHVQRISFGINANDKQSGSHNPNGIYEAIIYLDEKPLSAFQLDSITYEESRYVNANIDYKTRAAGGPYIQHLSRLPGYPEGVYKDINGSGIIDLKDSGIHEVKIVVKDANQNTSVLRFKIKKGVIAGKLSSDEMLTDPIEFRPQQVNVYEDSNISVYLPAATLYDSVRFYHSVKKSENKNSYSPLFSVFSGLVPSQTYFSVNIKADKNVPAELTDKMLMKRSWKGKSSVAKATRHDNWYAAKFNAFGDFELIADDEPPVIMANFKDHAVLSRAREIIITPRDNNDEIRNFRAELDGNWLRFTNDKGRSYIYVFDEKCSKGHHELKISVEDAAGNQTTRVLNFTK